MPQTKPALLGNQSIAALLEQVVKSRSRETLSATRSDRHVEAGLCAAAAVAVEIVVREPRSEYQVEPNSRSHSSYRWRSPAATVLLMRARESSMSSGESGVSVSSFFSLRNR